MFLNKCILNKAEILEKTQDLKTDKPLVNLIKTASQLGMYIYYRGEYAIELGFFVHRKVGHHPLTVD